MKIGRFKRGKEVFYGVIEGSSIYPLLENPFDNDSYKARGQRISLSEVNILSPSCPSKVVAVGLNYRDHAEELGMAVPNEPIIFLKPPTSVIGPGESILYPSGVSQLDYEAELAIVIKKMCCKVSKEEASQYIFGFTCGNDVTARDLQRKDGQWTRAKSFDTFAPLGPWVETDFNFRNGKIKLFLNGEEKQSSSFSQMIFDPHYLVSFISHIMTLCPGDVIMTGTPPGVGPMSPGDEVEVVIEGIGILKNRVVEEEL